MSEPAQKCENYAIFKQNYTLKLFVAFKMAYSCCFSLGGNLDFLDFLQKKFYNIDYRPQKWPKTSKIGQSGEILPIRVSLLLYKSIVKVSFAEIWEICCKTFMQ